MPDAEGQEHEQADRDRPAASRWPLHGLKTIESDS